MGWKLLHSAVFVPLATWGGEGGPETHRRTVCAGPERHTDSQILILYISDVFYNHETVFLSHLWLGCYSCQLHSGV